ncbi:MFS transporter [Paractinoplanes globisporus]|uniref:MFS transporter n=1 Tax=Paractinoplanes globisporus TaxID=113565 RepID=A0ABW6WNH7_9ACTN|nr:MFS transporter [Actinoplanes globisporus]
MPRPAAAGSYRAVLLLPSALRTFVPALGGRLAYGLLPLATLFTVQQATGSYSAAGLALALFGLASITLPAKSRLADVHGPRRVLPWLALVCALSLAAAALTPWPVAFVALAGLAAPPLGPAMRSAWRSLTAGTSLKERAYALDAIAEETLYLVGPLLAGLLIAAAPARWALLTTAALLLAGTLGMVAAVPSPSPSPASPAPASGPIRLFDPGPLRSAGLLGVLAVLLAIGAGTSVAYTAMAAVAQAHGRPGAAGLLEAAVGVGSVLGGLLWSRRRHTRSRSRHFAGLLGLLAAGLLAASVVPGLVALGAVMSVAGLAIAPLYVVAYLSADDLSPAGHATEAGTWVNVSANAGSALGAATAGVVTDQLSPSAAFLIAGTAVALAALAALVARPRRTARGAPAPTAPPADGPSAGDFPGGEPPVLGLPSDRVVADGRA